MFSLTEALVPLNLKKRVGSSVHLRGAVEPERLTTRICTSSMISMAATWIPALITEAAAAAASLIEGNVTTATEFSWGTTASFNVISVTSPSVPSEPTKRELRLYPALVLRGRRLVLIIVPSANTTVRLMTQLCCQLASIDKSGKLA